LGRCKRITSFSRRASASRPSGEWNDDDFDVLADGEAVGRIFNANAAPVGSPWMWTLIFPHHIGRTPTHGYAATRGRDGGVCQELATGVKESPGLVPRLQSHEDIHEPANGWIISTFRRVSAASVDDA
jgi:hypothetical protein